MKRYVTLLLALLIMPLSYALSTTEKPFVIGPESVKELEEYITEEDLYEFTVVDWDFLDEWRYYAEEKLASYDHKDLDSEDEHQLLRFHCGMLNLSTQTYTFDKYLTDVRLIYDARLIYNNIYEYEPLVIHQWLPNEERFIAAHYATEPLLKAYPNIVFKVPNLIETSKDPLTLYITLNGVEYMYKVR